jgi:hypothetical protein
LSSYCFRPWLVTETITVNQPTVFKPKIHRWKEFTVRSLGCCCHNFPYINRPQRLDSIDLYFGSVLLHLLSMLNGPERTQRWTLDLVQPVL